MTAMSPESSGMPEKIRIFSVDEANATLELVVPIIEQLQGLQQSVVDVDQQLEVTQHKLTAGNGYPIQELKQQAAQLTNRRAHLVEAYKSALEQLAGLGCLLKDLQKGLIDFYAMHDGDLVFLCWHLGEDRIRFWHDVEDGFAGRQPLT